MESYLNILRRRIKEKGPKRKQQSISLLVIFYIFISDCLYKISFEVILLRCPLLDEDDKEVKQVHDSQSGGHLNGKAIYHKLLRLGYYWPSMDNYCVVHVS